jgi:hypothetical protein
VTGTITVANWVMRVLVPVSAIFGPPVRRGLNR